MLIDQALTNPKIDQTEIEIFLAHLLGKDRSFITAFPEFKLDKNLTQKLQDFIKRRAKNEPLNYILGYKDFCNLRFKVDKRVMIPRPETEELVAQVLKHIYAIPSRERPNHFWGGKITIVDVGTGSGNIAISLAKAAPFAKIAAIEVDPKALEVAQENIKIHQVENQLELVLGNLLEPIKEPVDYIIANLPYVPTSKIPTLQPEIRDWEPKVALDGGFDGLQLYRELFKNVSRALKPAGFLFYEIDGQIYSQRN